MANETGIIMKRRFLGRILESGLLIIAVALGVGAAASGLSLMFHTKEYTRDLISSPSYKEIVVTTRANADDMVYPAVEKKENTTTLSIIDLKPGEIIDDILFSYIVEDSNMNLITEESILNFSQGNGFPGGPPPEESQNRTESNTSVKSESNENTPLVNDREQQMDEMKENFNSVKDNTDYIIPEIDHINGDAVTEDFFSARNFVANSGSLFAKSDYSSNKSIIVLGSELAKELNVQNYENIVGKKIMTWDAVYTVVGVLEYSDSKYDAMFLTPKKQLSNNNFRRRFGNSQLRFYVDDVSKLDYVAEQLKNWFDKEYGEGQVEISNPVQESTKVSERNNGIGLLILFLSLAGLFIASVNVSNILMSRSLRMKKHVGILKALGATRNSILMLFVKESLLITGIGALLGTVIAIPLSKTMEESLGLGDVSWLYILVGVLLSSILTLTFSVLPARQSAAIEAAEAMR